MTTIASIRHSERGICAKCGYALFVTEWSEYVSERVVLNLWSCTKCGYRFETEAQMPADAESIDDAETIEAFFPSLLVYADSPRIRRTPLPNGAIRILPNG